ncbi:MAG: 6-phospho-3-hexuloisomerase [Candidatus Desulfofervidus auxilii]|nr:6-phospho-3-hexuloisomerase [Candidatus Desulfofervidus auxilii]
MYYREIIKRIAEITERINPKEFEEFVKTVKNSPRIYVVGAGRSGLVAKAFAMRLVHLGIKVFVVGETVTPALREGDSLLAVSGSGKTAIVVETAKAAKSLKGNVIAVTSDPDSPLAKMANLVVIIPSKIRPKEHVHYEVGELMGSSITPLGTLFEVSTLIFFEACVAELMKQLGVKEEEMKRVHANL